MSEPSESPTREADRLIYAGLLGLAAASIVQMLDKDDIDASLFVAVYAFALAIPALAVGLITEYARRSGVSLSWWRDLIGIFGALSAVVGLGALFFHFGSGIGVVFATSSLLGVVLARTL